MTSRPSSLEEYLSCYPRLCAAVVAFTHRDVTAMGAAYVVRDAHERPTYCPRLESSSRSLVAQAFQHRHTLDNYHGILAELRRPNSGTVQRASAPAAAGVTLILTTEGFINVDQVCEYRLRHVDPATTDAIWGVDVLLSNGSSHLLRYNDPGFDQVIEALEDHGYTISTGEPR